MNDLAACGALFLAAFAAATVLPAGSEPLFVALLLAGDLPAWLLTAVASVGNVAGAAVNWLLGRWLENFRRRRWFPVRELQLARAQHWYRRYGRWSLLLSWAPFIGDALTVVAGLLRERLGVFLLLVTVAKAGRYVVLAAVTRSIA